MLPGRIHTAREKQCGNDSPIKKHRHRLIELVVLTTQKYSLWYWSKKFKTNNFHVMGGYQKRRFSRSGINAIDRASGYDLMNVPALVDQHLATLIKRFTFSQ